MKTITSNEGRASCANKRPVQYADLIASVNDTEDFDPLMSRVAIAKDGVSILAKELSLALDSLERRFV